MNKLNNLHKLTTISLTKENYEKLRKEIEKEKDKEIQAELRRGNIVTIIEWIRLETGGPMEVGGDGSVKLNILT